MPKEPKNIIKNKQITKNNQFSGKNNLTVNTKNSRKNFQKKWQNSYTCFSNINRIYDIK